MYEKLKKYHHNLWWHYNIFTIFNLKKNISPLFLP